MNTRWTNLLLERVRAHAAAGHSILETAEMFGVSHKSLSCIASRHGIRFGVRPHSKSIRPPRPSGAIAQLEARMALSREIAAARREAASAPLYRVWPP